MSSVLYFSASHAQLSLLGDLLEDTLPITEVYKGLPVVVIAANFLISYTLKLAMHQQTSPVHFLPT